MKTIAYFVLILSFLVGSTAVINAQKPQSLESASEADYLLLASSTSNADIFEVGASSFRYHTYRMSAGERVRIELSGDGDTDLDMYVYSSDGSLIDQLESYADSETSYVSAIRSGTIRIKVVNRGNVYNRYSLTIW
jgi:hypothetical protein